MRRGIGVIVMGLAAGSLVGSCGGSSETAGGCRPSKYYMPSPAMEPAIHQNDGILADDGAYDDAGPQRGDVVIFDVPPAMPSEDFDALVKRVVGLPGETIEINGGKVLVDGKPLDEPWSNGETEPYLDETQWTLDDDEYFAMGDNRPQSLDSRAFGPIERAAINSRVCLVARTRTTS